MLSYIKAKPVEKLFFEDFIHTVPPAPHYDDGTWLIELIARLRPKKEETSDDAAKRVSDLTRVLRKSPETLAKFKAYISFQIETRNHVRLFTEEGVNVRPSFFAEVLRRLGEKILPPLYNPTELADFLDACFCERNDYLWVKAIPNTLWLELWQLFNYGGAMNAVGVFELSLLQSILVLSHRISAMGLEPDLMNRIPAIEHFQSPFLVMDTEVGNFVELYQKRLVKSENVTDEMLTVQYERAMNSIANTMDCLEQIQETQVVQGVSMRLVYLLYRIRRAVGRMRTLLKLLSPLEQINKSTLAISLFKELVRATNLSHNLKEHFAENTSLLAYKVAEHTSSTGEHYITSTRKEYWDFLVDAMGGGFIIAFTNWVKFLIAYLNAAPLLGGILYSINYAGSFLTMHVFHFSLATKQPAMTASALARALDSDSTNQHNLENTADLITKISRSQFAAFLGNLAVVLPLAFSLSWIWYFMSGSHIATEEKAFYTIASFNPFTTLTVFYAALTGIILYLGSFVSGYCDNFVMYGHLHARVRTHRFWRRFISEKRLDKIGKYLEQNLGAIVGNLFLGFALGLTPIIGQITGLPLDVRHVTIASGGSAIAFAKIWDKLSAFEITATLLGVFSVGLMNFLVSFGLSLFVAIVSRRVKFKEGRELIKLVGERFKQNPMQFFFPIKSEETSDLKHSTAHSLTPSVK